MAKYDIRIIPEKEWLARITKTVRADNQQEIELAAMKEVKKYFNTDYITLKTADYITYEIWYRDERIIGKLLISKGV